MPHPKHIHIVTSIEDEASGPTYSVTRLAEAQAEHGLDVGIYSLSGVPACRTRNGVKYRSFQGSQTTVPGLNKLAPSSDLRLAVDEAARQDSMLQIHGLWRLPNVYPGSAAIRSKVPLLVSPRGMLGAPALKFSRTQKLVFWHLLQKRALRKVTCFHATAPAEVDDIRGFGLRAPVAVIPNGIDVPEDTPKGPRRKEVLHLGRIHPKKGIDRLLQAWAQVEERHPNWTLRIVGPDEGGHTNALKAQAGRLLLQRVHFEGPLFGADKVAAYRRAALFILPTRNENFGMVVGEALAQGTPVICTKGAPWSGLAQNRCGWWTDHGAEAMATALDTALALPDAERNAMGARGRAWMARDFGWDGIAAQMADVYAWCLGQGERPDCVETA